MIEWCELKQLSVGIIESIKIVISIGLIIGL